MSGHDVRAKVKFNASIKLNYAPFNTQKFKVSKEVSATDNNITYITNNINNNNKGIPKKCGHLRLVLFKVFHF